MIFRWKIISAFSCLIVLSQKNGTTFVQNCGTVWLNLHFCSIICAKISAYWCVISVFSFQTASHILVNFLNCNHIWWLSGDDRDDENNAFSVNIPATTIHCLSEGICTLINPSNVTFSSNIASNNLLHWRVMPNAPNLESLESGSKNLVGSYGKMSTSNSLTLFWN